MANPRRGNAASSVSLFSQSRVHPVTHSPSLFWSVARLDRQTKGRVLGIPSHAGRVRLRGQGKERFCVSFGGKKGDGDGDGRTTLMRTHRIEIKRIQLVGMFNHPPRLVTPLPSSPRSRGGTGEQS